MKKLTEATGISRKHYNEFCGNVKGEGFWKHGTFQGIPFGEETDTPGKWKVIFKNPLTGEFFTETYSWTNVPPNSNHFYN